MEQEQNSNKDNFKNAICYIPFVAIFLFFKDENKTDEYNKNIKYGIFLLIAYLIITSLVGLFSLSFLKPFIGLAYLGVSLYFSYKAYNGEKINIEVFDDLETNVKQNIDNNKNKEDKNNK